MYGWTLKCYANVRWLLPEHDSSNHVKCQADFKRHRTANWTETFVTSFICRFYYFCLLTQLGIKLQLIIQTPVSIEHKTIEYRNTVTRSESLQATVAGTSLKWNNYRENCQLLLCRRLWRVDDPSQVDHLDVFKLCHRPIKGVKPYLPLFIQLHRNQSNESERSWECSHQVDCV